MKLTKTILTAAAVSAFSVGTASALTVQQCEDLGGTVDLVQGQCQLTAAQEEEGRALGWLPASSGAAAGGAGAGLGTVAAGAGGGAAAGAGLLLAVVIIGDGSSTTTTTTTGN